VEKLGGLWRALSAKKSRPRAGGSKKGQKGSEGERRASISLGCDRSTNCRSRGILKERIRKKKRGSTYSTKGRAEAQKGSATRRTVKEEKKRRKIHLKKSDQIGQRKPLTLRNVQEVGQGRMTPEVERGGGILRGRERVK